MFRRRNICRARCLSEENITRKIIDTSKNYYEIVGQVIIHSGMDADAKPGREQEKWRNVLLRRSTGILQLNISRKNSKG